MGPQPLLDQALHEHEDADGDEEARPGAEVEQEGARRDRADRIARDGAQHERHTPGGPDENRRATAGVQRLLMQQPEPPLQILVGAATRDQELDRLAALFRLDGHGGAAIVDGAALTSGTGTGAGSA